MAMKDNMFVMALNGGVAPAHSTAGAINNSAGGANGVINTTKIPEGAIAIVSGGLTRATITAALAAADEYYFVKNLGGKFIWSPAFTAPAADLKIVNHDYSAGASTKVRINGITAAKLKCEAEYLLKLRFESPCIMKTYGYQDFVKTVSYTTGCCADPCVDCGTYPCDTFAEELVAQITAQAGDLVTAAKVTDGGCDFIDITAKNDTEAAMACGLDPMECSDYNVNMSVGLEGAFECSGAVVNYTGTGTTAYAQAVGEGRQVASMAAWGAGYTRALGTVRMGFPYTTGDHEVVTSTNYDYTTVDIDQAHTGAATEGSGSTTWPFRIVIAYVTGVGAMDKTEVATWLG